MKKSQAYKFVEKAIEAVKRQEKEIVENFSSWTLHQVTGAAQSLIMRKTALETAQEMLYIISTPEEITAIVREETAEKEYSFGSEERLNRNVLPKDKYCNHQEWSKDPKLMALMPNKRF